MKLSEKIKKIIPNHIKNTIKNCILFFIDNDKFSENYLYKKYRRKILCNGPQNSDKTFYVIRTKYSMGVFSYAIFLFQHCLYANNLNYIPIADQLTWYPNFFGKKIKIKTNPWELYFEQPLNYSLGDISKSKNIIIESPISTPADYPMTFNDFDFDFIADAKNFGPLFNKFIRLKPELKAELDHKFSDIFQPNSRILGVSIRRGIERLQKLGDNTAIGHTCDTDFSSKIKLIQDTMIQSNYDHCFITCDDEESINILKETFKDKMYFLKRTRMRLFINGQPVNKKNYIDNIPKDFETLYQMQKDYITEIYFLSKCTSLIASTNGGSIAAALFNSGKYEKVIIENTNYEKKQYKTYLKEVNGIIKAVQKSKQ